MKILSLFFILLFSTLVFGQAPNPASSAIQAAGTQVQNASSLSLDDLLSNVLVVVKNLGGVPWILKIASIVLLLVASLKVTALNKYWQSLGALQVWAAPILSLILGLSLLYSSGNVSLAALLAYVGSGSGAILIHELLDSIKGLPGLGPLYVGIIDMVEGALGGSAPKV